ncbi:hypothetical protein ES703_22807 [subsurface metagenome]
MIKRGDKTGQFYLISAIILATLVIGIVTISNYSRKESNLKLHDIKEEIQIESAHVLDYGLYNKLSEAGLYTLLLTFTTDYINYQGKDKDLYFVFGDQNNITVTGYQGTKKQVSVSSGSSQATITSEAGEFTGGIAPGTDTVVLSIDDALYEFDLNSGENFYFILSQKVNKGEYIITG